MEPGPDPGSSIVHFSGVAKGSDASDADRETYAWGRGIFESEDLPIAVECQQGIAAGERPIVIGRNEPVVQMWHRRWTEALAWSEGGTRGLRADLMTNAERIRTAQLGRREDWRGWRR